MAEGTSASPSGLGNIATLDHFDALAFVKYILLKNGVGQQQVAKPETFVKNGFCNNNEGLENHILIAREQAG